MRCRGRAYAHHARRHAGRGHADHARPGGQAILGGGFLVGQQQRARAIIDTARIAGRHAAFGTHHTLEFGQRFQAGFTRVLILADHQGIAFFLRDGDRCDLGIEEARLLRCHGFHLAGQGHPVLRFAADLVLGGDVLGRFGHGIDAVFFLHEPVDKAPANGGVVNGVGAAEGALGFGHDKRRAAHAFHAAGNHQPGFSGTDRARGGTHRVQARPAQAVDGGAWHFQRQAGQQTGHMRHIAVVLAGLVGAAVDHVGHGLPVHARVARHQRFDRDSTQVVGAHTAQGAAVAAEGGANGIADKSLWVHGDSDGMEDGVQDGRKSAGECRWANGHIANAWRPGSARAAPRVRAGCSTPPAAPVPHVQAPLLYQSIGDLRANIARSPDRSRCA